MTNEHKEHWYPEYYYPVTKEGIQSFLELETKSIRTKEYFDLMLDNSNVCNVLKKMFIVVEKKALPKTLEQYNSIAEIWEDYEVFAKKKVENMSWIRKSFSKYITIPIFIAYFKSFIKVDIGIMCEKKQEEFVQAMFLASIYLHL